MVSRKEIHRFQNTVWQYYRANGRSFPWRRRRTPYRVVVSEIMLQQTHVSRVAERFPSFVRDFPSFRTLALADMQTVLQKWIGLGYNRRARNLKRLAEEVAYHHAGRLPRTQQDLVRLPGVGQATAASIAAFAFNQSSVFIETNIRSAFMHHFFPQGEVCDSDLIPLVEQAVDVHNPREWYDALMDYGTMLKSVYGNPNVRSRSYVRQPRFEGSVRQARGAVLRVLAEEKNGKATRQTIRKKTELDEDRLIRALTSLEEEGFVQRRSRWYTIGQ